MSSLALNNHSLITEKEIMADPPEKKLLDLEEYYKDMELTEDTTCGIWFFKGKWLQRFANKKAYVFLYGILGCIFSATYAYFNGTITTLEKRFKIPSRTTGIISVGNDITQLATSLLISYYAGKGHRPRWIAMGIYTVVVFCIMTALPHLIYGPGSEALLLTTEYGAVYDQNATDEVIEQQNRKTLCRTREGGGDCEIEEGNLVPQIILFIAQLISGVGGSLYYTLGVSYMDDNIKKSKVPALISISYFLRMLGPSIGYALASFCLKMYISPILTPTITTKDPRWLGAWWLGWLVLSVLLLFFAFVICLFPKTLPRAAARKVIEQERIRTGLEVKGKTVEAEMPASIKDMMVTLKRLVYNPTLMLNNLASVFYFLGYMPYWIFMPKYIEMQYRQSASASSLVTGTVGLIFSAMGVLLSGVVLSRFKPRARYMAGWNVFVGALSALGMISYVFLGCPANDKIIAINKGGQLDLSLPCNSNCSCDYIPYSPVCSGDGLRTTFISACHAGCKQQVQINGSKVFTDCSCIMPASSPFFDNMTLFEPATESVTTPVGDIFSDDLSLGGFATPGSCPVDCKREFYIFLAVVCLLKFVGATGRATNFLVSVRCVDEKDKPVAMGFDLTILSLFAFIPSPILFGSILDSTCLVWGKTCTGTGNCWLYNGESLRYLLNLTAASFVIIGTFFDMGVWFFVKDLKIFDDKKSKEEKDTESKAEQKDGYIKVDTDVK